MSSRVPKSYKRNSITGELYRVNRISDGVEEEVKKINDKLSKANYPNRFVESVINEFKKKEEKSHEEKDESTLIPPSFFEKKRQFLLIEMPFRERKEIISKTFIKKLHSFTNSKHDAANKWLTKKTSSLFPSKDKNQHPLC